MRVDDRDPWTRAAVKATAAQDNPAAGAFTDTAESAVQTTDSAGVLANRAWDECCNVPMERPSIVTDTLAEEGKLCGKEFVAAGALNDQIVARLPAF